MSKEAGVPLLYMPVLYKFFAVEAQSQCCSISCQQTVLPVSYATLVRTSSVASQSWTSRSGHF